MPTDPCDLVNRHDEQEGRVRINALPSPRLPAEAEQQFAAS